MHVCDENHVGPALRGSPTVLVLLVMPSCVIAITKKEHHKRIRTKIDKRTESAGNKDCEAKHR